VDLDKIDVAMKRKAIICLVLLPAVVHVKLLVCVQVADHELIACRERMTWLLSESGLLVTGYRRKRVGPVQAPPLKPKKRKVEETEPDDFYDGLHRLYEDNSNAAEAKMVLSKRGSCASEVHHDTEDIQHPFVHTVAAV
jgi:hypothetical protein